MSVYICQNPQNVWTPPKTRWVKNLPEMQETQETWVQSLGREDPLEKGNGNPLQYSCLKNPMDRRAWWATVQEVTELDTARHTHST